MKILLIRPYWRVLHRVTGPPMGLISLASYIREKVDPAPEVILLDQDAHLQRLPDIQKLIEREKPGIIGISGLTCTARGIQIMAAACKKAAPQTPVVVGGPHASVFYDHVIDKTEADIAVIGEGEETFRELVERVRDGVDWKDTAGIAYGENGEVIRNPDRPPIMDLDSLPFPAWEMLDIPIYTKYGDMNNFLAAWPYMFIFTSRACPYGCIYCHKIFGKKFRARSAESTLEEIRRLTRDFGVRELHVIDDIFNWDLNRAKEICRGIIRENIKVKIAFPNGIRGDRLDDELIELLARAGCYSLTFAVETASDRLQKILKKNADLDKIARAVEKTYSVGIIPMGFYMLGFPTETEEEMEKTIRFACATKMLKAIFFSVVPYPRTEMFELFRQTYHDDFEIDKNDLDNMHYFGIESAYKKVTGIDLNKVVRNAYRRFYLDPVRIGRIFSRFPWNRRIFRAMYQGFRATWFLGDIMETWWGRYQNRRLGMIDETLIQEQAK